MASNNRSLALISSILHTPTPLPSIHSLRLSWSKRGPSQTSMRYFLRLRLPILQFHNPHMKVTLDHRTEQSFTAEIVVNTAHGEVTLYPAEIGKDSDIMHRIVQVGQAQSAEALQAAAVVTPSPATPSSPSHQATTTAKPATVAS